MEAAYQAAESAKRMLEAKNQVRDDLTKDFEEKRDELREMYEKRDKERLTEMKKDNTDRIKYLEDMNTATVQPVGYNNHFTQNYTSGWQQRPMWGQQQQLPNMQQQWQMMNQQMMNQQQQMMHQQAPPQGQLQHAPQHSGQQIDQQHTAPGQQNHIMQEHSRLQLQSAHQAHPQHGPQNSQQRAIAGPRQAQAGFHSRQSPQQNMNAGEYIAPDADISKFYLQMGD